MLSCNLPCSFQNEVKVVNGRQTEINHKIDICSLHDHICHPLPFPKLKKKPQLLLSIINTIQGIMNIITMQLFYIPQLC